MPGAFSTDKNKSKPITKKKMPESPKPHNSPLKLFKESLMTKINNSEKNKEWSKTSKNNSMKLQKKTAYKYKNFTKK